MVDISRLNIRKIIIVSGVIIGILLLLLAIVYLLTTGNITVKTGSKNTVTIKQIETSNNPHTDHQTGESSFRVPAGTYQVTVSDGKNSIQQAVTIKAMESKTITLTPSALLPIEPVTDNQATNLATDGLSLSYIDQTNHSLYQLSANGQNTAIDTALSFNPIKWVTPSYGIGLTSDKFLYAVDGQTIVPLSSLNKFLGTSAVVTFGVDTDKTVYVSNGSTIYKLDAAGIVSTMYTTKTPVSIIDVAGGLVLASERGSTSDKTQEGKLILIRQDKTTSSIEAEAYEGTIAPDGKHIAITGDEDNIITDDHLNKITVLPQGNVTSLHWFNDHKLLWADTNKLWQLDITSGIAQQLADTTTGDASTRYISSITHTPTHDAIYFTLTNTTTNRLSVGRVSLAKTVVPPEATKLSIFLPNSVDQCSFDFINLTGITIIVHGPEGDNDYCIQKAKEYLDLYNVPSGNFTFAYTTAS